MSSRAAVLASIRRSLGVTGDEATRRFEVETRLKQAPPGIVPKRGQGDVSARVATFKAEAERAQASVVEIAGWAGAPAEIARFLRESNCPATLRMGDDPRLAAMPWGETSLEILHGPSDGGDVNAVSAAFAGIAETGTLALVSGPDNPTTLNFLADNHIVVLPREAIEADYESVFAKLRGDLRQGRGAAHAQFHHRPLALGRHRADAAARRPRASPAAYRHRRLKPPPARPDAPANAGFTPPPVDSAARKFLFATAIIATVMSWFALNQASLVSFGLGGIHVHQLSESASYCGRGGLWCAGDRVALRGGDLCVSQIVCLGAYGALCLRSRLRRLPARPPQPAFARHRVRALQARPRFSRPPPGGLCIFGRPGVRAGEAGPPLG